MPTLYRIGDPVHFLKLVTYFAGPSLDSYIHASSASLCSMIPEEKPNHSEYILYADKSKYLWK